MEPVKKDGQMFFRKRRHEKDGRERRHEKNSRERRHEKDSREKDSREIRKCF